MHACLHVCVCMHMVVSVSNKLVYICMYTRLDLFCEIINISGAIYQTVKLPPVVLQPLELAA